MLQALPWQINEEDLANAYGLFPIMMQACKLLPELKQNVMRDRKNVTSPS